MPISSRKKQFSDPSKNILQNHAILYIQELMHDIQQAVSLSMHVSKPQVMPIEIPVSWPRDCSFIAKGKIF